MATTPRHKVVFIKDHYNVKDPVTGEFKPADTSTLYIRSYQPKGEKQHKKISLEIRLKNNEIKYLWDPNRQRFKDIKKNPHAQDWNDKIEGQLKKLVNYSELSNIPEKRKSFLKYWSEIIKTTTNHGTRIKQTGVKSKLEKFLKGQDLYFSEITPDLIRSIYHYFKTAKDPKRLKIATANHYMKIIHGVINVAKEDRYYNYDIDPFIGLTYNTAEEPILEGKVLEGSSLRLLLGADSDVDSIGTPQRPFPDELKKYRLSLLFQMFANGMRVSDMLLLRWNNFDGGVLRYSMFKTNKSMSMPMNTNLINILCKVILLYNPEHRILSWFDRFRNGENTVSITLENGVVENFNLNQIERKLSTINDKHLLYHALISGQDELIKRLEHWMSLQICITYQNAEMSNSFVFPYLKNEDFADIDEHNNFNQISEEQYKKIKHNTIVYNRNLKKITKLYGFNVNLTSHVARHSFASFLLGMGDVNTFDIQQMLGHSSIQITDKYLQKHFNPKKLNDTNRRLSNILGIK